LIQRVLKLLGALFFGAIYAILGLLGVVAIVGLAVTLFLNSQSGIVVFATALVSVVAVFASLIFKPIRTRIRNSKNGELPLLLFGVTAGTLVGMILSTAALLLGAAQFSITIMLVCSVIAPVSAMALERLGLLDLFDSFDLPDFFDD